MKTFRTDHDDDEQGEKQNQIKGAATQRFLECREHDGKKFIQWKFLRRISCKDLQ